MTNLLSRLWAAIVRKTCPCWDYEYLPLVEEVDGITFLVPDTGMHIEKCKRCGVERLFYDQELVTFGRPMGWTLTPKREVKS